LNAPEMNSLYLFEGIQVLRGSSNTLLNDDTPRNKKPLKKSPEA